MEEPTATPLEIVSQDLGLGREEKWRTLLLMPSVRRGQSPAGPEQGVLVGVAAAGGVEQQWSEGAAAAEAARCWSEMLEQL